MHGIKRVFISKAWFTRVLWLLCFAGAATMLGIQVTQLVGKYLSFQEQFSVDIESDTAEFPWITICDMRPLNMTVIKLLLSVYMHADNKQEQQRLLANSNSGNSELIKALLMLAERNKQINAAHGSAYPPGVELINIDENLLLDNLMRPLDDFMIEKKGAGSWNRRLLYCYGYPTPCHTYAFNKTEFQSNFTYLQNIPYLHVSAVDHSLGLTEAEKNTIYSHFLQNDASAELMFILPYITLSGARVYIHEPNTEPPLVPVDVPGEYIPIRPGYAKTLDIRVSRTERLSEPYGNCVSEYPFDNNPRGPYVQSTCKEACVYLSILEKCSCKFKMYAHIFELDNMPQKTSRHDDMQYCALSGNFQHTTAISRQVCVKSILSNTTEDLRCSKLCPKACTEITYDVYTIEEQLKDEFLLTVPMADSTRKVMMDRVLADYKTENPKKNVSITDLFRLVSKSLFRINIYLMSSDITVTTESASYTSYQLVSDIGGQLGLWVGMSVFTVLEVIGLLITLCRYCYRERKSRSAQISRDSDKGKDDNNANEMSFFGGKSRV